MISSICKIFSVKSLFLKEIYCPYHWSINIFKEKTEHTVTITFSSPFLCCCLLHCLIFFPLECVFSVYLVFKEELNLLLVNLVKVQWILTIRHWFPFQILRLANFMDWKRPKLLNDTLQWDNLRLTTGLQVLLSSAGVAGLSWACGRVFSPCFGIQISPY